MKIIFYMSKYFLTQSFAHFSNMLPSWSPFCPDGSSFCPLSSSGQEKVFLGVGLGVFGVGTYPQRGGWLLSKEQGLMVVFWAKWDPIWAKWDLSGQWKVGKSDLELGKKIQSYILQFFHHQSSHFIAFFFGICQIGLLIIWKQWKSDGSVKIYNCQQEIATDEIQEKK